MQKVVAQPRTKAFECSLAYLWHLHCMVLLVRNNEEWAKSGSSMKAEEQVASIASSGSYTYAQKAHLEDSAACVVD